MGETHPYTIVSMSDQATFLAQASRLTESENEIGCAVKLAKEHLGEDNHNTISIANNAADLYRDMGLTDTAEEMSSLSFHGARRLMGIDHPDTLSAMFLHSKILFQPQLFCQIISVGYRLISPAYRVISVTCWK